MFFKKSKDENKSKPNADLKPFSSVLPGLTQVKNIIAVASGKGGVGKSTVSTNLAYALKKQGHKVGLLDADIYGPTQTRMLGSGENQEIRMKGNQLLPIDQNGISFMSMGVVSGKDAPVVWRAPMAQKMISQFLNVAWGDLDYLIIDLPPGTGDVQITLSQQASLTGAIIVSTPQDVALNIAKKGLQMFQQVNVPILGIVENMSGFTCPHCQQETKIFKGGEGEAMAQGLGVKFLGQIPLDPEVMMSGDLGSPILERTVDSKPAQAILHLTKNVEVELQRLKESGETLSPKQVGLDESGRLVIEWPDGHYGIHDAFNLRTACACASCVDETTGKKILDPQTIPLDISISGVRPVGRYGMSLQFSDGHNTGIYKFSRLLKLEQQEQEQSFSV